MTYIVFPGRLIVQTSAFIPSLLDIGEKHVDRDEEFFAQMETGTVIAVGEQDALPEQETVEFPDTFDTPMPGAMPQPSQLLSVIRAFHGRSIERVAVNVDDKVFFFPEGARLLSNYKPIYLLRYDAVAGKIED